MKTCMCHQLHLQLETTYKLQQLNLPSLEALQGLGQRKRICMKSKLVLKMIQDPCLILIQQPQIVGAKSARRLMRKLKREFLLSLLMLIPTFVFFTNNNGCRYVPITSMSNLVLFVHKAKCTLNLSNIIVLTPDVIMLICFVFQQV